MARFVLEARGWGDRAPEQRAKEFTPVGVLLAWGAGSCQPLEHGG
jgi:hypothetical protein